MKILEKAFGKMLEVAGDVPILEDQIRKLTGLTGPLPKETLEIVMRNMGVEEKEKWPWIMCFYLTMKCNAACEFCSQGEYVYGSQKGKFKMYDKDRERQFKLLSLIRDEVPNIYFLGGEPTVSPHFGEVLEEASRLKFEQIVVNTNGLLFRPEILEHCTSLVVSLHCDDSEEMAKIYKVKAEMGKQVYENVRQYARARNPARTKMVINCVVTPDTIDQACDVADLALDLGIQINLAPAIGPDGLSDARLIGNSKYIELVRWVSGRVGLASGSAKYYELIENFQPFTCNPHTIPGLHPDGRLIVPCPNLPEGSEQVSLLEVGSVRRALKIGRKQWEEKHGVLDTCTRCAKNCHKACYIETAVVGNVESLIETGRAQLRRVAEQRKLPVYGVLSPRRAAGMSSPNAERELEEAQREMGVKVCNCDECRPRGGGDPLVKI